MDRLTITLTYLGLVCGMFLYLFWGKYAVDHNFTDRYYYTLCGKIERIEKITVSRVESSEDEFYMTLSTDNKGLQVKEIGKKTYLTHKVGQRICFNESDPKHNKLDSFISFSFFVVSLIMAIYLIHIIYKHYEN